MKYGSLQSWKRVLTAGVLLAATGAALPAQTPTTAPAQLIINRNDAPANPDALRFNFQGVALDTVLDYLSNAGGFVIIKNVMVEGRVDVVSHQPLTRDEGVALLNTVLNEKGYAAIRNDRTLTIVTRDEARQRDLPVRVGSDPEAIPKSDEMVTQIIPVLHANAKELIESIRELLPSYATIASNNSSNALVLTDTQTGVRRIAEIVKALDTSISDISALKVFHLRYADAKETADLIGSIFQAQSSSSRSSDGRAEAMQAFVSRMRGEGGGPGELSRSGGSSSSGDSPALKAASRVTAAADERTNALVISAPDDLMPTIEELITSLDRSTDVLTVVQVFPLKFADATEMAQVITDVFGEEGQTGRAQRSGTSSFFSRMMSGGGPGGPGGPFGGSSRSSQTDLSERKLAENTVLAVADTRTNAVIVSAASPVMDQVAQIVDELDQNQSKNKKVFVYSMKHANPEEAAALLQEMFGTDATGTGTRSNTSGTRNTGTSSRGSAGGSTGLSSSGFGSSGSSSRSSR